MPTAEELEEAAAKKFTEQFNELFHKASTEREKRLLKDVEKKFGDLLTTKMTELTEALKAEREKEPPTPPTPSPDPKNNPTPGQSRMTPEEQARFKQVEKDAKEAKERAERWETEAKAEKDRNRKIEERQQIVTGLNGKVKPTVLDMVATQLHQQHVSRDEETGNILWKDTDGTMLPLKDGLAAWVKSDLGKEFAPPARVGGAGGRGPGDGAGGTIKPGEMTLDDVGSRVLGSMGGGRQG